MPKNSLLIKFDVTTNYDITVDEATEILLKAEMLLNERTKLRWSITEVTLKDIKSFVEDKDNRL